jgi:hypothetical protein
MDPLKTAEGTGGAPTCSLCRNNGHCGKCCHLPGEMLNLAAEAGDRAQIHISFARILIISTRTSYSGHNSNVVIWQLWPQQHSAAAAVAGMEPTFFRYPPLSISNIHKYLCFDRRRRRRRFHARAIWIRALQITSTNIFFAWDGIHQIVSRFLERFRYMCPLLFSCVFPS